MVMMEGVGGLCSMAEIIFEATSKVGKVKMRPPMEGKAGPISTTSSKAGSNTVASYRIQEYNTYWVEFKVIQEYILHGSGSCSCKA